MDYIKGQARGQMTLLPDCIDDLVSPENPVRVIDAFVDGLDMEQLGFQRAVPNETGRPSYDPRDMLKLYVYGYFNKTRSSRKLMVECGRNIEMFFLLNRLTPDFRTIGDFRKDNAKALKNVFRAFVRMCMKLGLYHRELVAVDGSKFRAVNSSANCYNAETLEKKLRRIDEHIAEYLKQLDAADENEQWESQPTPEQIREALAELTQRKERYQGYLKKLEDSGETQLLTTDPEARRMHSKDGFHCCYNVQTAVDDGSHLIAEYEVTNHNTDQGLLRDVAESVKDALDLETVEVVADKGYESREDILNCVMNGIVPNVALKYDKEERVYSLEYEAADITEEQRNSTKPEDIHRCLHAGVLPACYEGMALSVQLQGQGELSCFTLNDDGMVTCPMGNIFHKLKTKGVNTVYGNKDACRQCKHRCTAGKNPKTVSFGPSTRVVPVEMYGASKYEARPLPEDLVPYNSFHRKDKVPKTVLLTIRPDRGKLRKRMCLSEHPFGTVKWYHGAHYLLCKGKEKATAELGLSFLAYNLRRAINLVGIEALIRAM